MGELDLEIEASDEGDVRIWTVTGEINLNTAWILKDKLQKESGKKLALNLEKVSYLDSMGISALVELQKKCRECGRNLVLAALTPNVLRILQLTRMEGQFSLHGDIGSAVTALKT